jgi:hypothetical protein
MSIPSFDDQTCPGGAELMLARELDAKRVRVITLLNAIADLHEGDLREILKLDQTAPIAQHDHGTFEWDDPGGALTRSDVVRTGEELARILEDHLKSVLICGEGSIESKKEFGGRRFV